MPGSPTDFLKIDLVLLLVDELSKAFEFICSNVKHAPAITSPVTLRDELKDWPPPQPH